MSECATDKKKVNVFLIVLILFAILIAVGTIGYKYIFDLTWINALYSASVVLTSTSIETTPKTTGQKLFVSIYSIISVVVFLSIASYAINGIVGIIENKL